MANGWQGSLANNGPLENRIAPLTAFCAGHTKVMYDERSFAPNPRSVFCRTNR